MITTEEEAKTKLCPETFGLRLPPAACMCEGSACMAWRWIGLRLRGEHHDIPLARSLAREPMSLWPDEEINAGTVPVGCCGKAPDSL